MWQCLMVSLTLMSSTSCDALLACDILSPFGADRPEGRQLDSLPPGDQIVPRETDVPRNVQDEGYFDGPVTSLDSVPHVVSDEYTCQHLLTINPQQAHINRITSTAPHQRLQKSLRIGFLCMLSPWIRPLLIRTMQFDGSTR